MTARTSVQSGDWHDPATWGGFVPVEGDTATVAVGHTVTLTQSLTIGADSGTNAITISGILDIPSTITQDIELVAKGNIVANTNNAEFRVGSEVSPMPPERLVKFRLNYSSALSTNKYYMTTTGSTTARLLFFASPKLTDTTLTAQANAGTTTIEVAGDISTWRIGDRIGIGTKEIYTNKAYNETRLILGVTGNTITLDSALTYSHIAGMHVIMLSSNIVIEPYNTTYPTYVTTNSINCVFDYVTFNYMGTSSTYGFRFNSGTYRSSIFAYMGYHGIYCNTNNVTVQNVITYGCNTSMYCNYFNNCRVDKLIGMNQVGSVINVTASQVNFSIGTVIGYGISNACFYGSYGVRDFIVDLVMGVGCSYPLYASAVLSGFISLVKSTKCSYGVYVDNSNIKIGRVESTENTANDIRNGRSIVEVLDSCLLQAVSPYYAYYVESHTFLSNYNDTEGAYRYYGGGLLVENDSVTYRTTAPSCKFSHTVSFSLPSRAFLTGKLPTFFVEIGQTISLTFWVRTNVASDGRSMAMQLNREQLSLGLDTSVFDISPSADGVWEQKTLNLGTATKSGAISMEVISSRGASVSFGFWIDDLELVVV